MPRFDPALEDVFWLLRHIAPSQSEAFDEDTTRQVLDEAARFIGDVIAPLNAESDRVGARLVDGRVVSPPGWREAYAAWVESGWQALGLPEDQGGMGAPAPVQAAVNAMLAGADLGFAMVLGGSRAGSALLAAHADAQTAALCLPKLASGEWAATIAMTEAGAGTDVGQIQTKAAKLDDGRYAITGTKIFISGGDQDLTEQILHLVLGRIAGAPGGTRGLSLFLVPARRMDADGALGEANGVSVASIEEKMGLHGSATCVLDFAAAEGVLIGAENAGLAALFTMMNEMRLDVGLSAVGIAACATSHALDYAKERRQGRGPDGSGPVAIIEHPDVRRMLSLMAARTEAGRALALHTARLIDMAHGAEDSAEARLAALLTPVCKSALSDMAAEVASLGVQVFGGHGYVTETGAERFLRDARVLPLYEGANGVQAIDLVVRKLQKDGGAGFADLAAAIRADLERLSGRAELSAIHGVAQRALEALEEGVAALLAAEPGGRGALAAATPFLDLTAHAAAAWMWLKMAGADAGEDDPILVRKRGLADFFAAYEAGTADALLARVRGVLTAPELYDAAV